MGSALPFEASVERRDGMAVIALRGELDLATREAFEEAVTAVPPEVGLVLDAGRLEFVDGGALGRWAELARARQRAGATFLVRNPSPFLLRMLRICELEWLMEPARSRTPDLGTP